MTKETASHRAALSSLPKSSKAEFNAKKRPMTDFLRLLSKLFRFLRLTTDFAVVKTQ
ncbi:hypothetical protein [Acinetobacter sp. WC-323]|uniref:hypothetical protein n=1 Tax=Acinetobacter sp. WC-323 TaxID=903918 RepID=UPI0012DB6217|nr:hypothetical protein [Acinetobacter sp. WC-323]